MERVRVKDDQGWGSRAAEFLGVESGRWWWVQPAVIGALIGIAIRMIG